MLVLGYRKAVGLVENCVPTSLSNDQESKEGQQEPWCNIPKDLLDSPPPWLCSFRNTGNNMERCKFFHPMHNDAYEIRINPEVSNATILFSGYGWLLLSKGYGQLFLFDLTTKQSIDLPDCSEDMVSVMSFTSSPASPDCLVVGLSSDSKSVHVYKWDDEEKMFQPIKRLGDYMLFVSHGASCSERAIVKAT
ncbi:hypothetical protein POUND7_013879, partial [Theobroma cacao]